ncbi:MAG: capsule biosynthesis protein CapA [Pseudomonadota bacterium]
MQAAQRKFLFLQGPHGPFFGELALRLSAMGAGVMRVCLNAGDRAAWPSSLPQRALHGPQQRQAATLTRLIAQEAVTDIVMYGDARPLHDWAIEAADGAGLRRHIFEEGYLRPHWITYERSGTNGNSPVLGLSLAQIRAAVHGSHLPLTDAPTGWGAARAHATLGALYHARTLAGRRAFPDYRSHRGIGLEREAWLNLRRLLRGPRHALTSRWQAGALRRSGRAFHLGLLQLGHDGAVRRHSPFSSMAGFIEHCVAAFAQGAPDVHHLVLKTHPFEDMREPLVRILRRAASANGVARRVHLIQGGPLGPLLDAAQSVVTVNSTAGQQALWRGLPLAALGRAVYAKPGLVSAQPLAAFFAAPDAPDHAAYLDLRRFLLATSQFRGSYYTRAGRREALSELPAEMLAACDRYVALMGGTTRPDKAPNAPASAPRSGKAPALGALS